MHTAAVLIFDKQTLSLRREWRCCTPATTAPTAAAAAAATPTAISSSSSENTARFALTRCAHAAALLGARYAAHYLASYYLLVKMLRPSAADFSPDSQGLLPLTARDLGLRAYVAGAWLVDTSVLLAEVHDIFSAVFVWALAWDAAAEWMGPPPLFGRIREARSVRWFWGVFWYRLHVAVFDAYMPAVLRRRVASPRDSSTRRSTMVVGAALLRTLWMFAMSAVLHMAASWVVVGTLNAKGELFFFLGNYVVCVVETVNLVGSPGWSNASSNRRGTMSNS
ncbi:hypothetical protein B0H66DRAFT_535155 [Apodospora peruviana]|uniref:Wax synthase domain-containing protein n=1 Tax=Apodospora peruviana TaxID=516989 RepID=A0AAE0I1T0_9PEZI|nr:hypothetical protein B0H66DRAFT_535155 [Apodospora peruviana]